MGRRWLCIQMEEIELAVRERLKCSTIASQSESSYSLLCSEVKHTTATLGSDAAQWQIFVCCILQPAIFSWRLFAWWLSKTFHIKSANIMTALEEHHRAANRVRICPQLMSPHRFEHGIGYVVEGGQAGGHHREGALRCCRGCIWFACAMQARWWDSLRKWFHFHCWCGPIISTPYVRRPVVYN